MLLNQHNLHDLNVFKIMLSFQEKCDDRAQKKRSKSRKSIIKRKSQ